MRPTPFLFRVFIVLSVLFALAGGIVDMVLLSSTPEMSALLRQETGNSPLMWLGFFIALIICVAQILGLFFFKRWGRALALYVLAPEMALSIVFMQEPWLTSTLAFSLYGMSWLLLGAILVMAYWTLVKEHFERA
ncbi:MAG: hypothetical protein FWH15_10120 [Betaproteobacteria bacterium]|nr:hypothetical protein [Betaproteobacteria bacterium]